MGVLIAARKFGNTEGYRNRFIRSELTSLSVGYAQLSLPTTGFKTWYAFGIPRNDLLATVIASLQPDLMTNK